MLMYNGNLMAVYYQSSTSSHYLKDKSVSGKVTPLVS
jgi:hypothetical protein